MLHHTDRGIWFVILIIFIFLVGNFIFTQYEITQLKNSISVSQNLNPQIADACGSNCQSYINNAVNQAIVTQTPAVSTSPTPTPKVTASQAPKTSTQITYIPLTGGNTQNTDWVNINASQFALNIGDYGAKAYATWDANLRVDNANGTTFARLFDTTHSIAVNGSEINISNTSTSTDVVSGQLQFWQGNNTYVIQVKSLNGSIGYVDSGRIKIVY